MLPPCHQYIGLELCQKDIHLNDPAKQLMNRSNSSRKNILPSQMLNLYGPMYLQKWVVLGVNIGKYIYHILSIWGCHLKTKNGNLRKKLGGCVLYKSAGKAFLQQSVSTEKKKKRSVMVILLMEEILHHLGCIRLPTSTGAGFLNHQQYQSSTNSFRHVGFGWLLESTCITRVGKLMPSQKVPVEDFQPSFVRGYVTKLPECSQIR